MEKKKGLFVPVSLYEKAVTALKGAGITNTSRNGLFVWDGISFIIGLVAGVVFGILVF